MALKINKTLTTKSGLSVPSGTIVRFRTIIEPNGEDMIIELYPYSSAQAITDKAAPYEPKEFPRMQFNHKLTEADQQNLSALTVHTIVKTWIESKCGVAGNEIEIV